MEATQQETIEQNETAARHEAEKLFRPAKKQSLAVIRHGRMAAALLPKGDVKEFETPPLPKGGHQVSREKKVLSLRYFTANGREKREEMLVPLDISREEVEAISLKTIRGGRIIKATMLPYAPKD